MHKLAIYISALALSIAVETTIADEVASLRGDPAAVADAAAMVETMGGNAIRLCLWASEAIRQPAGPELGDDQQRPGSL